MQKISHSDRRNQARLQASAVDRRHSFGALLTSVGGPVCGCGKETATAERKQSSSLECGEPIQIGVTLGWGPFLGEVATPVNRTCQQTLQRHTNSKRSGKEGRTTGRLTATYTFA